MDPIKPDDVARQKKELFPDGVIEAFNELIAETFVNGQASFKQEDVVERIVSKGIEKTDIFSNHWLDVEEIYIKAGWKVKYDQPAYNETYPATFTFTKKN